MEVELVPVLTILEKAALKTGPGRHELVKNFFVQAKREPIYHFLDSYGRIWVRAKDVDRVIDLVLPPVKSGAC